MEPSSTLASGHRVIYSRSVPCVGSVGPSIVGALTLVGMLAGGAGLWPGWLPGSEPSGSCWPMVGSAGFWQG